jgi:hypothetical protein
MRQKVNRHKTMLPVVRKKVEIRRKRGENGMQIVEVIPSSKTVCAHSLAVLLGKLCRVFVKK